jgi:hypothetical protein
MDDILKADLESLNEKLISISNSHTSLGLLSGKMGYCIYFYKSAKIYGNNKYAKIAGDLLDSVCNSLGNYRIWNIENGLAGIGLGINYLVKEKFVAGDINRILKEFDILLFKQLTFPDKKNPPDLWLQTQLLYYFGVRMTEQKKGSEGEYIFKQLIFKILNSFSTVPDNFFEEPYSFSMDFRLPFFLYTLGMVSKQNMFSEKVKKITDDLTPKIISFIPVLHSHRVYLIFGMSLLIKELNINSWQKHIRLLRRETDAGYMFENELRDKNIFFKDGISGLGFILTEYNKSVDDSEKIEYNPEYLRNRIKSSEAWQRLMNDEQFFRTNSGLNGFCGLSLLNYTFD